MAGNRIAATRWFLRQPRRRIVKALIAVAHWFPNRLRRKAVAQPPMDVWLQALNENAALAEHAMERVMSLDETRRYLAGDDPLLDAMLANIEQASLTQIGRIYRSRLSEEPTEEDLMALPGNYHNEADEDGEA